MTPELKAKILSATRATRLGAILACAMGDDSYNEEPHFVGKASVTSDGYLMCDAVDDRGDYRHGAFVGALESFDRNLLGLAEHLDLAMSQREELFALGASWIGKDWRSSPQALDAILAGGNSRP